MWKYNDKEFLSENIGDYLGFVYIITNKNDGMKYIGKKLFKSTKKLPPLKGKTRRRTKVVESDWKTYYGSNKDTIALVEEFGGNIFEREILHLCHTKGELSYMELKEQMDREVLLRDDYYNGIVNVKIHKSHVKKLKNLRDCG